MEPEKNPEKNNTLSSANVEKTTAESLHDAGIDLVGSGISEENEFSSTAVPAPTETFEVETTQKEQIKPTTAVIPATPNTPVKTASIPTAAEIIAALRQAKPIAPQAPVEKTTLSSESAKLIASLQEIPSGFVSAQKVTSSYTPAASPAKETMSVQPNASLNDPSIKQIRTFKSDAEEAVRYQNVSAVDIALAEQRKREKTAIQYEAPAQSHRAGIFIMIVILLMILLGGGWYFWFSSSQVTETRPSATVTIKTIIPYAKIASIVLDPESDSLVLIGAKLKQGNAGLGNVYALIPVASSGATSQADVASVFKDTLMPSRLARSLDQNYMIGTYTYDTQNPFIILKNTFFQNAFSGMLEWEKDMRRDLLPLSQIAHDTENAVTAASSQFEDSIVSNIDARALKDADGKTVLIYAFADKDTIVITTGESSLKYLLERLLTVRTIQ